MLGRDIDIPFPENLGDPMNAQPAAVRFQDLFLVLSQCVDLGLLSITAAFRSARHLKKIFGSGFEMIRISQCESPRSVSGRTLNTVRAPRAPFDMKSLFLPSRTVSLGRVLAMPNRSESLPTTTQLFLVSPTESAEALEACNFQMRELLAQARRGSSPWVWIRSVKILRLARKSVSASDVLPCPFNTIPRFFNPSYDRYSLVGCSLRVFGGSLDIPYGDYT
jgi:hypothetical protein